jgi:cysteine desulfurase
MDVNDTTLPIYLDYMATTPVDPRVRDVMMDYLCPSGVFGNPASNTHCYGRAAANAIKTARADIADALNARSEEIVFTSGATESDNLAILGAARFYQRKGRHLITMTTEHKAVLDSFNQLEREGFEVTYLNPKADGLLDLNALEAAITPKTILVSIMHVNNEIGVIQDIQAIADCLKGRGIVFHVDAAQSVGKLPIDLSTTSVDLLSLSAHKVYGPKGIGALYVRREPRIRIEPLSFGGGHEGGMRSGTLPTHQIMGMAKAVTLAYAEREAEQKKLMMLRQRLWAGISDLPGVQLNGSQTERIAGNLNILFSRVSSDELLLRLDGLAVSTTSACSSSSHQPSYVLQAIGLTTEEANHSVRISIGRFTADQDVDRAIQLIRAALKEE